MTRLARYGAGVVILLVMVSGCAFQGNSCADVKIRWFCWRHLCDRPPAAPVLEDITSLPMF